MALETVRLTDEMLSEALAIGPTGEFIDKRLMRRAKSKNGVNEMACTNRNCPAYGKCLAPYRGSRCNAKRASYGLGDPLTNADRIRAMSDEELAAWINNACRAAIENHQLKEYEPSMFISPDGESGWIDWLKKEATDAGLFL